MGAMVKVAEKAKEQQEKRDEKEEEGGVSEEEDIKLISHYLRETEI